MNKVMSKLKMGDLMWTVVGVIIWLVFGWKWWVAFFVVSLFWSCLKGIYDGIMRIAEENGP